MLEPDPYTEPDCITVPVPAVPVPAVPVPQQWILTPYYSGHSRCCVGKLRQEMQRLEDVKRANMQQLALFTANTGI
jgi:hypothetical protein